MSQDERQDLAAEVERLREEESARVEARRREIADIVEEARVAAANTDRDERKKLASGLEEAHGRELAETKWRIEGHDDHFKVLNGSVEKLAGAVEDQARATVDLRQELRDSFAQQERAALKRELAAKDKAEAVEKKAEEKEEERAVAAKAESSKQRIQILVALIGALAIILVAVIS
jgi:hypothetical protein